MRLRSTGIALGLSASAVLMLVYGVDCQSTTWPVRDAPAELRTTITRADLIVVTLHDALRRELNDALAEGGPARAMKSCHLDAIGVAQRIGRQEGVAAGRTSDRLRNPLNAPRPWAAPIVTSNAGRSARDVDGFVVDLGEKLGVLRPIAHRPECGSCHGRDDRISAGIRAELRDRYPSDRATGFRDGEIRGWYWVEIPKPRPNK